MRKNVIKGLTLILLLSVVSNGYLFLNMRQMSKELQKNNNRIQFMENNFDQSVRNLIVEETKSKDSDILEDVKFIMSDMTDKQAKKAMIDVEFKLKRTDSTAKTYASVECGEEEPYLLEIFPINDTTYKIEREICLLQPLRIDLVIEKYGEKKLINLVTEDQMYKNFAGESNFNLMHFDYDYNQESKKILANFAAEIKYFPKVEKKLEAAYVSIEKNGVTINRLPLEIREGTVRNDSILYYVEAKDLEILGLEKDNIIIAVTLKEKNGFIHRYEFVKCYFEDGEENVVAESSPVLT
ncbi:MAG: hypothetical protein GX829_00320, partial [Clostridium sp.]|nr:hypothetical protein [Clostridium sp.]